MPASSRPGAVNLEGQVIHPGVVHTSIAGAVNSLPTPLLATLALLLAGILAFLGATLSKRVRDGRSH